MGGTFLLVQRNLVGEDVKAAVDLHGVGADHLDAGEVGREVDGQPRLAGARGAHHNHHLAPPLLRRRRRGVWSRRRGGGGHLLLHGGRRVREERVLSPRGLWAVGGPVGSLSLVCLLLAEFYFLHHSIGIRF